jgi:hypothetical protein
MIWTLPPVTPTPSTGDGPAFFPILVTPTGELAIPEHTVAPATPAD